MLNRTRIYGSILFLAFCNCVLALWSSAAQPAEMEQVVESLVAPYQRFAMFDGVILLAQGDTVVHHASYGEAVAEWGVKLSPDARFRIASISKTFTALAIGMLIQQDRISLDTTLQAILPEIPYADRITVRQLAMHRSGIVHLNDLEGYDQVMRGAITVDSLLSWIARQPLDFDPGTDYKYSNGGYVLLACVIERISGMTYGAYLERHVFELLGLSNTDHEALGRIHSRLARGYQPGLDPGGRAVATYVAPDIKIGGGSLISSAPDLLRFVRALEIDARLPRELLDTLLGDAPVRYLSGRAPGYNAVVMRNRVQDLTVIVLSNSYAVTANSLAPSLMSLLSGDELPPPPHFALGPSVVDWKGAFRWPPNFDNDFRLYRKGSDWIYDEGPDSDATIALSLDDGTLLLPLYDVRCSLEESSGDLICTAPWSSQPLRLTRLR